ncbi:MAG: TadE/TadG family type IV pilus assembly protein [Acidiferrobacterales bacterium]
MNATLPTTIRSGRKTGLQQRGVAAVEFAIVLPVLLLLMFGTAELGRAFFQYNTLTKAVRDGARYVSRNALDGSLGIVNLTAQVDTETRNLVVYGVAGGGASSLLPGFTPADVSVVDAGANNVTVSATYAYTPMVGATLPTFGLGSGPSLAFTLQATVTMRAL